MINTTWTLYILLCDNKSYYVGITNNLNNRLREHKNKQSFYTKQFSEIKLVYKEEYNNEHEVRKRERQLKGWSVAKKKALIEGKIETLKRLAESTGIVEVLD